MTKRSESVKKWRKETKKRLNEAFGNKCGICEYNRCSEALELHHLDPSEKEISFGQITANPKSWDKIITEARKCILLCCRCHREVHFLSLEIPEDVIRFNESYADYRNLEENGERNNCPICGKLKLKQNRTCSYSCAARLAGSVDWDNIDLLEMRKELYTFNAIGNELGISGTAVAKRWNKLYN